MLVDLNPMPYVHAMELVRWCYARNIDRDRCAKIIEAVSIPPSSKDVEWIIDVEWVIDVPDRYMTYFALKWI
jgi:hypothetical protein